MKFFLGVDGGQSSTTAVIGDDCGRIRGWAVAGPCNHVGAAEGRPKFLRVMRDCVGRAAAMAGLDAVKPGFGWACLGMSGGPDDKAGLLTEVFEADRIEVTHDGRIALAGAHAGEPGVIVISGTGTIAFGQNESGKLARAGGWGYVFGDEGGGFDVVRQAVRAMLREHEGWGPRTALTGALLAETGAADANALVHLFYTEEWPRARVAALAPVVDRVAEEGDATARGILHQAAQSLAMLAGAVRGQLWGAGEPSRLAWIGGTFRSAILLERFRMLAELDGNVSAGEPAFAPSLGALILAYRAAGLAAVPENLPFVKS
jgi:N-acetylglucosamine kinase-like BadF-type ATPase